MCFVIIIAGSIHALGTSLPPGLTWATPGSLISQNPIYIRSQQSDMFIQSPPPQATTLHAVPLTPMQQQTQQQVPTQQQTASQQQQAQQQQQQMQQQPIQPQPQLQVRISKTFVVPIQFMLDSLRVTADSWIPKE